MIGTHSVVAYADRNAAGWGAPLFTNSYFDTDLAGWTPGPFIDPWTWSGGAAVFTSATANNPALHRTTAATINRPPNVASYRERISVTLSHPADVFIYLNFGTTREGAALGDYWRPGEAIQQWGAKSLQAGTSSFDAVFDQYDPPGPEYIYLGVAVLVMHNVPSGTPFTVAVNSFELHYRSTGTSADLSCLIDEVAIVHGRDSASGQPEASSATIDLTITPEAPLPTLVDIGAVLVINTTTPDGAYTRFTGRVTDLVLAWDDAGEDTPYTGVGQLVAVSLLADLARRVVGDTPWAQELDGARVARILDLAGEPLDPRWSDAGTVQILARDVDSQPALDVATGVAESAGGMLWQARAGDVRYADAEHRRGIAPSLVLDACDILVTPQWRRDLEGMVNEVSIGYGVTPDGGEQPRYLASSPDSITRFGRYEYSIETELAALVDAQRMGELVLVRNASPVWILSALPVSLADLDATETAQVLGLEMHALIQITGFPAIGNAPTITSLWVEGWRERLAYGVHELELFVSGYCRTAPPPRWNDLSPATLWDTVGTLTWNDAACLGPMPPSGIWDAVPASTRWDYVDPALTWNTYPALI
jgi:hypothetical protein